VTMNTWVVSVKNLMPVKAALVRIMEPAWIWQKNMLETISPALVFLDILGKCVSQRLTIALSSLASMEGPAILVAVDSTANVQKDSWVQLVQTKSITVLHFHVRTMELVIRIDSPILAAAVQVLQDLPVLT